MKRLTTLLCTTLATALAVSTVEAQDESQKFVGETTVNVIEVPVRVIDRETGEPVTGLTPGDFRVFEAGKEQKITNFSEISKNVQIAAASASAEGPGFTVVDEETPKSLELVYFFDLFLMYKSDRERAIDGLSDIYRSGIPDGESVSLVVFDGELETFVNRSDDRYELMEALDDLRYVEANGIRQRINFSQELADGPVTGDRDVWYYERRQRNREFVHELEKRVQRVGNAMLATMARFAKAEGRRVLVSFTPGFPRSNWAPTYYDVDFLNAEAPFPTQELWQQISREAADLGFTLYNVDTFGLSSPLASDVGIGVTNDLGDATRAAAGGTGAVPGGDPIQFQGPTPATDDIAAGAPGDTSDNLGQWLERTRRNLLISSAKETGGDAIFAGDVAKAVDEIKTTLDHYYSVAYTAEHIGDGKAYEIEVELPNHPKYRLVHRTAYVDQPASTRAAQALRSEMLFGGDANPLGVRVEVGESDSKFRLGAAESKRVKLPIDVQIPYARLEMIPRGEEFWGKVLITFFSEDAGGNQSELVSFEQPITVPADRYEEAVAKGYFSYKTTVQVEGGTQELFVGVQDTLGGRTSILPQEFDF
jgi:VWFA-related protein